MSDPRRSLGARGEELAAGHLAQAGLTIVARNWRCVAGELDLVATEPGPGIDGGSACWLVCVEVRTRRGQRFGTARQSITPRKEQRLREVAAHYVQTADWVGPWRIDVIAVQLDGQGRLQQIEHIRHAVTA